MANEVEFGYPELEWLQNDECFVEQAVLKVGENYKHLMIKQTIKKSSCGDVSKTLKQSHNAEEVFLTTIEK